MVWSQGGGWSALQFFFGAGCGLQFLGGVVSNFSGGLRIFFLFFSIFHPPKPPPPRRSMRGRYASYWNAFLYYLFIWRHIFKAFRIFSIFLIKYHNRKIWALKFGHNDNSKINSNQTKSKQKKHPFPKNSNEQKWARERNLSLIFADVCALLWQLLKHPWRLYFLWTSVLEFTRKLSSG